MANTLLDEGVWDLLLRRIEEGRCTPLLGAGICSGVLPLGSEIAREWAMKYNYPLEDTRDLARVAQFLAVEFDPMFTKEKILELFKDIAPPDFTAPDEPHGVLADLPFPVYITTNYDDFMVQALRSRNRDPVREVCRWHKYIRGQLSVFDRDFRPTAANPVVFHLHGHIEVPESLVLTEDDYLDFLVNVSRDPGLLPPRIQMALTGTSLLFIGYGQADRSFRGLFRGLVASMERGLRGISVIAQLPPVPADALESTRQRAQIYLERYFDRTDLRVYWGTARDFSKELRKRWEEFSYES